RGPLPNGWRSTLGNGSRARFRQSSRSTWRIIGHRERRTGATAEATGQTDAGFTLECLPRRLKRELPGHDTKTAPEMGWASKRNGELQQLAEGNFDVFLTVDRKLQHQQDLTRFGIGVIVLINPSNRFTICSR